METLQNSYIYFVSDFILIFGVILSAFIGLHIKNLAPKWHLRLLNTILALMLLGFLPFLTGFLKLTNLDIFSNLVPFTDYNLTFLSGSVNITPLNLFFKFLITLCAFITSLLSFGFVKKLNRKISNFTSLFLISLLGGYGVCISNDFITLFLSVEILSVALYFLIASFYNKKDKEKNSLEASVKYFIINEVASCFMLLGISYIYLNLGTINFSDINTIAINKILPSTPLLNIGEILFFLALTFKIGAFPFYIWLMDVFKGSNYSIGLFISSVIKTVGAAALIKTGSSLGCFNSVLSFALILCACITLVIGNLIAARIVKKEGDIKDFLASSSISNIGYVLLGIAFFTKSSITASIFFLIVYLISNFGLWAAFMLVVRNLRKFILKSETSKYETDYGAKKLYVDENLGAIKGVAYISPFFATLVVICLLSFAGFPVMAGFTAKFYLFSNILRSGIFSVYPLLFAAFASILAVYYNFKIISFMFQKPDRLKIYKKKPVFNRVNIYIFILSMAALLLIAGFFLSTPVINILNNFI